MLIDELRRLFDESSIIYGLDEEYEQKWYREIGEHTQFISDMETKYYIDIASVIIKHYHTNTVYILEYYPLDWEYEPIGFCKSTSIEGLFVEINKQSDNCYDGILSNTKKYIENFK